MVYMVHKISYHVSTKTADTAIYKNKMAKNMQVLRRCASESETLVPKHKNNRRRTQSEPLQEADTAHDFKTDVSENPITSRLFYLIITLLSSLTVEELSKLTCNILRKKDKEKSEGQDRETDAKDYDGPENTKLQCVGCKTKIQTNLDCFQGHDLEDVLRNIEEKYLSTESSPLKQSFSTFYKNYLRCFGSLQPTNVKSFPLIDCSRNFEEFVKKELSANECLSTELTQAHNVHSMNLEIIRLGTFSSFPQASSVSTLKLAKDGFYYTGEEDKVTCYACGIQRGGWRQGDDPREIHRQMSPNCSFINSSQSENVPIGRAENITNLTSASQQPDQNVSENSSPRNAQPEEIVLQNSTSLLSNSKIRNKDNSTCFSQTGNTCTSSYSHQSNENQNQNSERQFTEGSRKRSRAIQEKINTFLSNLDPLGINFDRPKYPSYAVVATRVSSFKDWPSSMTQKPRDLSVAGFLYAGYGDYTRCFFCGGGLRNWEPEDDPWIEHARWFPKCAFLRQNKGDEFVALVQIEHEEQEKLNEMETTEQAPSSQSNNPEYASSGTNSRNTSVTSIYDLSSVQSVLDMGYSRQVVKEAFDVLKFSKHEDDITGEDLMNIILSKEDNDTPTQNINQETKETSESVPSFSQIEVKSEFLMPDSKLKSSGNVHGEIMTRKSREEHSLSGAVGLSNSSGTSDSHSLSLPSFSMEDTKSLIEENRKLRDLRLCKICLENDASIAMLPCRHLCCCPDCAPAMRKCPICRQFVKGTVRTRLV